MPFVPVLANIGFAASMHLLLSASTGNSDSIPSLLLPTVLPLLDRWFIQGGCRKTISRHQASYFAAFTPHILIMPEELADPGIQLSN